MSEEPQYVCNICNEIYIEGNIVKSYDSKKREVEDFYCNECFFNIFALREPEEFKMVGEDGQENGESHQIDEGSS